MAGPVDRTWSLSHAKEMVSSWRCSHLACLKKPYMGIRGRIGNQAQHTIGRMAGLRGGGSHVVSLGTGFVARVFSV
jgi:hypothetical protein